ncbi:hypothetical protein [Facklamia sp. P9177]
MNTVEEMAYILAKTIESKNDIINQLSNQIQAKDDEIEELKKQLEETEG